MWINLQEVVEYLCEHKDKMYVLPGQNAAMTYNPPTDEVIIVPGDFSGDALDCAAEMKIALERHNAWLN